MPAVELAWALFPCVSLYLVNVHRVVGVNHHRSIVKPLAIRFCRIDVCDGGS